MFNERGLQERKRNERIGRRIIGYKRRRRTAKSQLFELQRHLLGEAGVDGTIIDVAEAVEEYAEGWARVLSAAPRPRNSREHIPARIREEVLTRDGYRCRICGASSDEDYLEIDHLRPVSQGGTNAPSNLRTLCRRCNRSRGAP